MFFHSFCSNKILYQWYEFLVNIKSINFDNKSPSGTVPLNTYEVLEVTWNVVMIKNNTQKQTQNDLYYLCGFSAVEKLNANYFAFNQHRKRTNIQRVCKRSETKEPNWITFKRIQLWYAVIILQKIWQRFYKRDCTFRHASHIYVKNICGVVLG